MNGTTIDVDEDGTQTEGQPNPRPVREPYGAFPLQFNQATTIQSPFFWIVIGAAAVVVGYYLLKKKTNL